MKKSIVSVAALAVLQLALSSLAEQTKEPKYASEKPLYARVALDEKGTKVLTLAFDESEGTGKGYDTIYADLNLNGNLTDDKPVKGEIERRGASIQYCRFPTMEVGVPYNEKASEVKKPWEIALEHYQFTRTRFFGLIRGETQRMFMFNATMRLKDEDSEWQYSFFRSLEPAKSPGEASATAFAGKLMMQVETRPDPQKKGNTGFAVYLRLGTDMFRCSRTDKPITAHLHVKNERGETAHSEDVGLDKLFFG